MPQHRNTLYFYCGNIYFDIDSFLCILAKSESFG